MKVVGLLSGGKDSCYNLCHCVRQGHELVALATLAPPTGKDEIDSYMYQTVGHDGVHLVAQALGVPLYRRSITGQPLNQDMQYRKDSSEGQAPTSQDETEDLYELLLEVKQNHPDVEGVSVGAILSNYQRIRVEHVSLRPELQLTPLTYLWQRSQDELLDEMVKAGINAVLIKVAGIGLDERDLGKSLAQMQPKLRWLNASYGAHVCGEGGEYETLTLDCPLFKNRIELVETEVVTHAEAAFASVAYLRVINARLVAKPDDAPTLASVHIPADLDSTGQRTLEAVTAVGQTSSSSQAPALTGAGPKTALYGTSRSARSYVYRSGDWFHVSSLDGLADDGTAPVTIEEETTAMFSKLKTALEGFHLTLQNVTHVNLYLASQSDFARVNAVYKTAFQEAPPSRACVGIRVHQGQKARVALDAVAVKEWKDQRCLHVQGRSYWAPANIGPYSQAMLARERISIAGQIGLRPADLSLPGEDFDLQCALSLQHARRIHVAVLEGAGVQPTDVDAAVEGGLCWIENVEDGSSRKLADRIAKARAAWSAQSYLSETTRDGDEDSDDDTADEDSIVSWLGGKAGRRATELPILYVVVPFEGLPRGAGVEWQLTACTGRSAASTLENDDDDDDDDVPVSESSTRSPIQRGSIDVQVESNNWLRLAWHSFFSVKSQSSMGMVTIQRYTSESTRAHQSRAEELAALRRQISAALSIRVFVTAKGAQEGEEGSPSTLGLATTLLQGEGMVTLERRTMNVSVDALFAEDDAGRSDGDVKLSTHSDPRFGGTGPIEVAFVWNGVDPESF
ncbi:hypothetical protein CF327_g3565 [Tilletia walkeri]|uniref:Diphthine--ammonia ligase n=1 Tax=Tilletia walkeri TaxID=117179 RepID=A0A8X7T6B8_9BASI|nr:hypothetical protein CF327_g3565 [Tilletia walkeri]KAE8270567.1 hypothetical protein A4X09_0g1762 [Tilletia walkeri]